jgi:hypothetical protein
VNVIIKRPPPRDPREIYIAAMYLTFCRAPKNLTRIMTIVLIYGKSAPARKRIGSDCFALDAYVFEVSSKPGPFQPKGSGTQIGPSIRVAHPPSTCT